VLEGLQETPKIVKARARLHVADTQTQQLLKDNSAYRAQSSHHSTRPHGDDEEEDNLNDLRLQLNQQDLRLRINNHHWQCDAAERERRR
jgi:phage terminase small subunit